MLASLRAELETRARADAALRARLIDAESRLAARVVLEQRTSAALAELRTELDALGGELARERTLRLDAERRTAELERELRDQRVTSLGAYEAIGELREALERLATPPEPEPAAQAPPSAAQAPPRPRARRASTRPGPGAPARPHPGAPRRSRRARPPQRRAHPAA